MASTIIPKQHFSLMIIINPSKSSLYTANQRSIYLSKKRCVGCVHDKNLKQTPHPWQVGKLLEGEIDELPDLTKAGREIWE